MQDTKGHGKVPFHIGVPGPTARKRLERIAAICEVPADFLLPASTTFAQGDSLADDVWALVDDAIRLAERGDSPRAIGTTASEGDTALPSSQSPSGPSAFVASGDMPHLQEELVWPEE